MSQEPSHRTPDAEIDRLQKRLARERARREELEVVAENATRRLFTETQALVLINDLSEICAGASSFREALTHSIARLCKDLNWESGVGFVRRHYSLEIIKDSTSTAAVDETFVDAVYSDIESCLLDETSQAVPFIRVPGTYGTSALLFVINANAENQAAVVFRFKPNRALNDYEKKTIEHLKNHLTQIFRNEIAGSRIHELSNVDEVTRLPARHCFVEEFQRAIPGADHSARKLALFVIDINHFKHINNTHGRSTGDRVLHVLAWRLAELAGSPDMVCRWSADHFAFFRAFQDDVELQEFAQSFLHDHLEAPFHVDHQQLSVSANCGYVVVTNGKEHAENLVQDAEAAMTISKSSGKGVSQRYTSALGSALRRRATIEQQLKFAIDNREFFLAYQPIWRLRDRSPHGLEALIRWNSSTFRSISPAEFVPLLESTGLIGKAGRLIFRQCARDLRRMLTEGAHINKVHVNLSPAQLRNPDIVDMVNSELRSFDIAPHLIELEITEGIFMSASKGVQDILRLFRSNGYTISIDDFGSGYSSFAYLSQYEFDTLKIDKSLIDNIGRDSRAKLVVESIVNMAHLLGHEVIVEGVETSEQAELLAQMGCDCAQGYFFCRPTEVADIIATFKAISP